jgi:L-rhamnose mutarotase
VIRRAFRMSVNPGQRDEYARRHQPIWQELADTLRAHGVQTYSIFVDQDTDDLFAYVEFDSIERWEAVAATDVCRRWWHHMRDVMPATDDGQPLSRTLTEVFHLGRH